MENQTKEDLELDEILNILGSEMKEELLMEANKLVLKDSEIFSKNFSFELIKDTVPLIK